MFLGSKIFKGLFWEEEMVDFDSEFEKGPDSYNEGVGKWWKKRADDRAHAIAYGKIAKFIRDTIKKDPKAIIDYACGTGRVLERVAQQFPETQLYGLDGSKKMLKEAHERLQGKKVHLMESRLPNFSLPTMGDVIIFTFPNIVPHPDEQPYYDKHGYKNKQDVKVATFLAKAREEDPEEETVNDTPEDLKDILLTNKVISRNIRKLVKKGGYFFRVEYANGGRDELTPLVLQRTRFEEGCLVEASNGKKPVQFFKEVAWKYFPSKVIEDVYHQTRDKEDKKGGFYIVAMKAV